jgi:hypothetical protein
VTVEVDALKVADVNAFVPVKVLFNPRIDAPLIP